jgi:DNA-binding transcriptional LysR family regulator
MIIIRDMNGGELLATDRLDLLKLFVRIVETGHISEAAQSLGMSQPSASRCLKHLEAILDTPSFSDRRTG